MYDYSSAYIKDMMTEYPCICGHDSIILQQQQDRYNAKELPQQRRHTVHGDLLYPPSRSTGTATYVSPVGSSNYIGSTHASSPYTTYTYSKPCVNTIHQPTVSYPPLYINDVSNEGIYQSSSTPTAVIAAPVSSSIISTSMSPRQNLNISSPNLPTNRQHQGSIRTTGVVDPHHSVRQVDPIDPHHQNYPQLSAEGYIHTPRSIIDPTLVTNSPISNTNQNSMTPVSHHYMNHSPIGAQSVLSQTGSRYPESPLAHRRIHTTHSRGGTVGFVRLPGENYSTSNRAQTQR